MNRFEKNIYINKIILSKSLHRIKQTLLNLSLYQFSTVFNDELENEKTQFR